MAPAGVRWTLVLVMVAVAVAHCASFAAARLGHRHRHRHLHRHRPLDVDLTHVGMGAVMAMMLVGSLSPGASRAWAAAFAAPTLWFAWRTLRSYVLGGARAAGADLRQVFASAAMVYMLVLAAAPSTASVGRMPGMAMPSGTPAASRLLGAVLLAAVGATAIWTATRLRPRRVAASLAGFASPVDAGCQFAMSATTVYMLALLV